MHLIKCENENILTRKTEIGNENKVMIIKLFFKRKRVRKVEKAGGAKF